MSEKTVLWEESRVYVLGFLSFLGISFLNFSSWLIFYFTVQSVFTRMAVMKALEKIKEEDFLK